MNQRLLSLVGAVLLTAAVITPAQAAQNTSAPDNTKTNKMPGVTADQAKNGLSDREVMRQIRREVMKDKSLSTYGHNVKIVSQNGKVTLRGPVHSDDEKTTIGKYAQNIAGDGNVINDLAVKN